MKPASICMVAAFMALQGMNAAFAQTFSDVNVRTSATAQDLKASGHNLADIGLDDDFSPTGGRITATAGALVHEGDSKGAAAANANAQVGHLGVSVLGSAIGAPKNRPNFFTGGEATTSSVAIAKWGDTITISSRSRIALRAVFNVILDGELSAVADDQAGSFVSMAVENGFKSSFIFPTTPITAKALDNPTLGEISEDIPGGFRVQLFPPEGPFTIGLVLSLDGHAVSNVSLNLVLGDDDLGSYSGKVSRSLTWGGLEGVFDFFTGERLDDWTITSASGFDYSQPFRVPEPSSLMLGTVLCAILAHRWRSFV